MSQQRSISVKLVGKNFWEVKGCTHPHKALLLELGCEWQAKNLSWMWHGDKLPTALEQLKNGTYGLEGLSTDVLALQATTTPKPAKTSIAPKRGDTAPQNSDVPKAENQKFQMGDRVKTNLGRLNGTVQGYHGSQVVVAFPKYEPFMINEDDLSIDDVTVYFDQLKEGSKVIWMATSPKGYNEIVPVKATVHKINPKTIQIEVEEKVEGDTWITVKRNVKLEHLRWPKAEA